MKQQIRRWLTISYLLIACTLISYSNHPVNDNSSGQEIKVSIIYDNYDFKPGLESDWGFSCLIEGCEKTILFDTGARGRIFKQNFDALNIDANKVDYVVISHDHYDHVDGLEVFIEMNKEASVYMLHEFSNKVKNIVEDLGGKIVYEPEITEICKNVYLSGELGNRIKEQSLAIDTPNGLVIITGCSHPGIIEILKHFKTELTKEIYMVFGGFHLMQKNKTEIDQIITEMKALGVQKCGATHCTGKKQIEMFKESFGADYVQMGVGNLVEL